MPETRHSGLDRSVRQKLGETLEFHRDAAAVVLLSCGARGREAMRVLITVGFLGHFGETDGVVTTYRNLLPFFERRGPDLDVVAYGPEDRTEDHGRVRLHVHRPRLPVRVDPRRWVDLAFSQTALARTLARTPYSLVQSSTPDPMGLWARGVARRQAVPFVAVYHTALAEYAAIRGGQAAGALVGGVMGRVMGAWMRAYYGRADLILAPSETVRAELAATLRPPAAVLSRGVDSRAFHPDRRTRGHGRVRALYVGRVAPEKNLDLVARVFAARPDIDLTIVGDGPSVPDLREALPSATFTGRLMGEPLAQAYADADFFVFPSRTDTLGNVVLEAMASGLPVVVSDAMGPKELVRHGETGFVMGTDAEFAAAVDMLTASAGMRRTMGAAARRYAETRSWEAIFEQLLGYYEQSRAKRMVVPPRAAAPVKPAVRHTRPLCVLDITEFFGETSGGVKTYLTHKVRYVESRRDLRQVVVVPGAESRCSGEGGVRWYHVRGPAIPGQHPYRLMIDARQIRAIIESERPDIIEIGSHFVAPWLVADVARASGIPVVWFCHSNLPRILAPYPTSAWPRRRAAALSRGYMRTLSRRCAGTLAPSDSMARDLEGLGIRDVWRVSLGVDLERFDAVRRERSIETRRRLDLPAGPLVLYAGRITAEKGVDLLLDAWPLVEQVTGAHLALVGDGPGRDRLQARCRARQVHWRPYEPDRERLADLMAAADLYVAPSVVETFGLAALEAMACDTPVLSADQGAVAEHVERSGAGSTFLAGSAASLAERAIDLLSRGRRLAQGRDYVARRLSWPSAFDRIFGVYEEVLRGAAAH